MADTHNCSTRSSDEMRESREYEEDKDDNRGTASTLLDSDGDLSDLEKHRSGVLRAEPAPTGNKAKLTAWILVNTLATIGIVSPFRTNYELVLSSNHGSRSSQIKPFSPRLNSANASYHLHPFTFWSRP